MTVRPIRSADRPALRRLQRHLASPAPSLLSDPLVVDGYVSTDGDTPVGYVLTVGGGKTESADGKRGGTHVAELVVAPGHRREGRATALLERVLVASDGPVSVLVAASNEAALSLYRSMGFEERERRPDAFASDAGVLLVASVDA